MHSSRLAALDPDRFAIPPAWQARLLSPALVIFLDHVRSNVAAMLRWMDGDPGRWRPHLKTTKSPRIWEILLEAGVRHFKCATPREAQVLLDLVAQRGLPDVDLLVAYAFQQPHVAEIAALARRFPGTRVSILSEDPDHAAALPEELGVFVDINPEMDRTGIPLADGERIRAVGLAAGRRLRGMHFYDGHVRDSERAVREARCWALYDRLVELDAGLRRAGQPIDEWVTSGTPAFPYALSHPGLRSLPCPHRISPGTVVFHDAFSDETLDDVELTPAALLFSRIISHPAPGLVTCDAGSKSLAAEAGDPAAFVLGHPEWVARRPSEEHLPLAVTSGASPPRGTPLLLVPRHVCPTVNLAETALVLGDGGEPEVMEITARAHGLLAQVTPGA